MDQNAEAIVILCSHLCVGKDVKPLEPQEWNQLAKCLVEQKLEPRQLLEFSDQELQDALHCTTEQAQRIARLTDRSASLGFEISRYASIGIKLITRVEEGYPKQLKRTLGNACPPIFYYAGKLELLESPCVGYVGSRAVEEQDIDFAARCVEKTVGRGYGVVSGGARGIDTAAETEALFQGGQAVVYLADSMMRRIKKRETLRAIQDERLVLLSPVKPDAPFQVGVAMARNRLIYCQSEATVVVRSDLNKGGTWAGATECLRHQWRPVFCWDNPDYPGNAALIQRGAIAVDSRWNGDVTAASSIPPEVREEPGEPAAEPDRQTEDSGQQLTLFD